jgi:tetratricopeptide (TPR) repeat protein
MQKILDTVQFQVSRKPVYRWYAWTVAKETKANEKIMDTLLSHLPPLELGDEKSRELAFAAIDRMIEKKAYPRADEELSKLLTRPDLLEADRPKITRRRALLAYHQGRLEEALGLYAELGKIAHEEAWSLFRQISILRQLGRDQEAQSLTDQLRSRHPESYWSRQIR